MVMFSIIVMGPKPRTAVVASANNKIPQQIIPERLAKAGSKSKFVTVLDVIKHYAMKTYGGINV
jgi:hypothetical protein